MEKNYATVVENIMISLCMLLFFMQPVCVCKFSEGKQCIPRLLNLS